MGRLPDTFAGQRISPMRPPFVMSGSLTMPSATGPTQFPASTFMVTEDKPFEIHRMIPRVIALDASSNPAEGVAEDLMLRLISVQVLDLGKNQEFTKQAVPLHDLIKGTTERTWEWAEPYYLRKGENFIINLTSATYPAVLAGLSIRVQISFGGFLVVVAPPSDRG